MIRDNIVFVVAMIIVAVAAYGALGNDLFSLLSSAPRDHKIALGIATFAIWLLGK